MVNYKPDENFDLVEFFSDLVNSLIFIKGFIHNPDENFDFFRQCKFLNLIEWLIIMLTKILTDLVNEFLNFIEWLSIMLTNFDLLKFSHTDLEFFKIQSLTKGDDNKCLNGGCNSYLTCK